MTDVDERFFDLAGEAEARSRIVQALAGLPHALRRDLARIASRRELMPGDVLCEDGEELPYVGYVREGSLCMGKLLPDGRSHIIGLVVQGDFFGRLDGSPTSYRIEALDRVRLHLFERAGFERILRQAPSVERLFQSRMVDDLEAAREWILLLRATRVSVRLASFLLILLRRQFNGPPEALAGKPVRLRIPLRRAVLAQYLGTRPESLSRAFHQLQAAQVLRIIDANTVTFDDLPALVAAAGQDPAAPVVLHG